MKNPGVESPAAAARHLQYARAHTELEFEVFPLKENVKLGHDPHYGCGLYVLCTGSHLKRLEQENNSVKVCFSCCLRAPVRKGDTTRNTRYVLRAPVTSDLECNFLRLDRIC